MPQMASEPCRQLQRAICLPAMGDAHDKDDHNVVEHCVDDDIVLARVNASQMPLALPSSCLEPSQRGSAARTSSHRAILFWIGLGSRSSSFAALFVSSTR